MDRAIYEELRDALKQRSPGWTAHSRSQWPWFLGGSLLLVLGTVVALTWGQPPVQAVGNLPVQAETPEAIPSPIPRTDPRAIADPVHASEAPSVPNVTDVPDVPDAPPPPPHNAVADQTFFVRVGSFRNPSNAERVVRSLRDRGAAVSVEVLRGELLTVLVGPFTNRAFAVESSEAVNQLFDLTSEVFLRSPQQSD